MKNYEVVVHQIKMEDGSVEWGAFFPCVKGCCGGGKTPEEAVKTAYENLDVYLEVLKEEGLPIPQEYEEPEYSGKFTFRTSRTKHKQIVELAKKEGLSLNNYLNELIDKGMMNIELIKERERLENFHIQLTSLVKKAETCLDNNLEVKYDNFKTSNKLPDFGKQVYRKGVYLWS